LFTTTRTAPYSKVPWRGENRMQPEDGDESKEFVGLVYQLTDRLNIAPHPNPSTVISAARALVENLSTQNNNSKRNVSGETRIQRSKLDLEDISLPIETNLDKLTSKDGEKDELVETFKQAAKVLKLLYLNDLKQEQLRVNEIISDIQSITANPKTDSTLAATGR